MNNIAITSGEKDAGPTLTFQENVDTVLNPVDSLVDKTRIIAQDSADLSNLTEREILITTLTYTVGSTTVNNVDPWSLFITNKRVINRLNNFRCLFGKKLRVRAVVAASPFAYGRIIIAYQPFNAHDNCTKITSSFTANAIVLSQKHNVELSITDGETAVIELPFLWPEDAIDLQVDQLSELGKLIVYPLSPLAQANGSTAGITIAFFASMEGIEVHRPTTVNAFNLVNQARPSIEIPSSPIRLQIASPRDVNITCGCCGFPGYRKSITVRRPEPLIEPLPFVNQARELGTISSTLEEVADVVGSASQIPIVGKYASGAKEALSMGAKAAQAFGYSAPEDTRPLTRVVPRPLPSISHATGFNDYSKNTLDPMQAVKMSSEVVGFQDDVGTSMTKVCEKECIVSKFTWNITDTVNKCLWNTRVTPNMGFWDGTYRYSPPSEFAMMPFDKFRFSNCFTIDAVASKMHRGKLLILYDPSYIAAVELNVLTGVVLDLGDSGATCMEVRIPWSQPYPLAYNPLPGTTYNTMAYSTTAITSSDETSNGVLGVYVLSPLSTTSDTAGLSIEVLVRSKVCEPKCYDLSFHEFATMSFINQAKEATVCDVAQDDHKVSDLLSEFGGEVYDDFLAICAKPMYSYVNMHDLSNTDVTKYYTTNSYCARMPHPPCRGVIASGTYVLHPDGSTGATNANKNMTAGLNYYAPAYAMCRGGVKYIANYSKRGPNADKLTMLVTKQGRQTPVKPSKLNYDYSTGAASTAPDAAWNTYGANQLFFANSCGSYGVAAINPTLSWECPWQSKQRFRICREVKPISDYSLYAGSAVSGTQGYRTYLTVPTTGTNTTFATAFVAEEIFTAKGEDYALYWFQGMPAWTLWNA